MIDLCRKFVGEPGDDLLYLVETLVDLREEPCKCVYQGDKPCPRTAESPNYFGFCKQHLNTRRGRELSAIWNDALEEIGVQESEEDMTEVDSGELSQEVVSEEEVHHEEEDDQPVEDDEPLDDEEELREDEVVSEEEPDEVEVDVVPARRTASSTRGGKGTSRGGATTRGPTQAPRGRPTTTSKAPAAATATKPLAARGRPAATTTSKPAPPAAVGKPKTGAPIVPVPAGRGKTPVKKRTPTVPSRKRADATDESSVAEGSAKAEYVEPTSTEEEEEVPKLVFKRSKHGNLVNEEHGFVIRPKDKMVIGSENAKGGIKKLTAEQKKFCRENKLNFLE